MIRDGDSKAFNVIKDTYGPEVGTVVALPTKIMPRRYSFED